MRRPFFLLGAAAVSVALAACTAQPTPCKSSTRYDYNPEVGSDLSATVFPDDFLTVDSASSVTGLNVSITPQNSPWTTGDLVPSGLEETLPALNSLDGWGTTAGISMRFSAALKAPPSGYPESTQAKTLQLWELGPTPKRVPFEVQRTDNDTTLILWPMVPLKPATLHAVLVTRDLPTTAGDAVCPSDALVSLLDGTAKSAAMKRLLPRYAKALQAANLKPEQVGAAVTFTTQTIEHQSVAIAQDIQNRSYSWKEKPTCQPMTNYQLCSGTFTAQNYQTSGVVLGTTPVTSYDIPVRLWLPLSAPKPWPVMIFGHGLGGEKDQGEPLGAIGAQEGIAVVAIDAVAHGQHPGDGATDLSAILRFFGMSTGSIQPLVLRDNWRQSTYDKLQLLKVLEAGDLDGDGQSDVDLEHFAYYGASLGGIMGSEFLALQDRIDLGVLAMPGGRVMSIISDAQQFAFLPALFAGPNNTAGDIARFFPIMQAIIERGDASNYGPHVLADRFPHANGRTPHVLFMEVYNDDTVPNVCTRSLARGYNLPQMSPMLDPVGYVPELGAGPVSMNILNGTRTAGLFEYDRMTTDSDPTVRPAEHPYMPTSKESLYQVRHLLTTWLAGRPEIVDPYLHFETPPLPPKQ